jgi:hypothetical protein
MCGREQCQAICIKELPTCFCHQPVSHCTCCQHVQSCHTSACLSAETRITLLLLLLTEEDELMGLDVSKHGERAIAVDHTFVNSSVHNGSAHGGLFGVQAPAKAAVVDKAEAA